MRHALTLLIVLLTLNDVCAQIRIEVIKHPKFILKDSSLFISGTFNNWSPGEETFKLTRRPDGVYYFDLPDTLESFEYKFTQGGWQIVEGYADGKILPNRVYNKVVEDNPHLIRVVIEGWEKQPEYTIIVDKVPENTPFDASLYVAGNFNNWNPGDKNYRMRKQIDGSYQILIYFNGDRIDYKFTRGTWKSAESKSGGRTMANRVTLRASATGKIRAEIAGWEDISGGLQLYSIYDLLLLFSVFQGVLLIVTIPTIQEYNREANRWLILLVGFTSAILLIKVVSAYPEVEHTLPKLQLIPDFILFIYAPLFYAYIQRLLFRSQNQLKLVFFVPVFVQFFVYMIYFLMDQPMFQAKLIEPESELRIIRFCMGSLALALNIYYWIKCQMAINTYKVNYQNSNSYEQNLQYLNTVLFIQAACLVVWFVTFAITGMAEIFDWQISDFTDVSIDTLWMTFSVITFFLGYFVIHEPDIFRLPQTISQPHELTKVELDHQVIDYLNHIGKDKEEETIENLDSLKEKLTLYMEKYQPYTNPKLSLVELASRLKLQPHILSKVINSGFGMNFFDYVNTYRIDEFKRRVEDPQYKNYTLLGIALDVGFNSKTAFNRSFKKITSQTPSAFFNTLKE
ncbi:helix-turn-helix domain-containing protein [Chryseolinea sp. Jin1]|uniref:Helix-turn-helix domain-containing protein n=1 Tax=Chryseolinea lacunae TaxID=2801331 RepID=A0ABS1L1L6_9BACT|nr:helix-turn-helix domain-containing protein [Chryseolinea lacunae]